MYIWNDPPIMTKFRTERRDHCSILPNGSIYLDLDLNYCDLDYLTKRVENLTQALHFAQGSEDRKLIDYHEGLLLQAKAKIDKHNRQRNLNTLDSRRRATVVHITNKVTEYENWSYAMGLSNNRMWPFGCHDKEYSDWSRRISTLTPDQRGE